jgi:cystathionine beta-lyase/cystathionine gamma-synthase
MANEKKYSIPTRLIYGKFHTAEWDFSHHVIPPMTLSSTFRLDSVARGVKGFEQIGRSGADPIYVYDRMAEPTSDMLQHALATAEEGESAVVFSTGMAAVHAATTLMVSQGDEIISHKVVYGCTYSLFTSWMPRFGVKVLFADMTNADNFLPLVSERTRLIYLESPANPTLEITDVRAVCERVAELNRHRPEERRIYVAIDNTFATPYCQRPLTLGADFVIHSLTKGISGFGTEMGGAVICRKEFFDPLILSRKDFGASLSPRVAWQILVYGLSTLSLRVERQQANAMQLATFLEGHAEVERVIYPGLASFPQAELARRQMRNYRGEFAPGFMIFFTLKGSSLEESREKGEKLMNYIAENSYTLTLAVSLGQLRTLIEHPGSMTHASYSVEEQIARGMHPGGIRLAVGIEEAEDLMADLGTALDKIRS